MEYIITILTSGVIATILSYITNRHGNKLTYITSERKEWRKEIRLLIEEINESSQSNVHITTAKLKARLNTYGLHSIEDYDKDSHIWIAIQQIETTADIKYFNLYKNMLIEFLSLLLKDDWEKAKKEVASDIYFTLEKFLLFLAYLTFFYFCFWEWKLKLDTSIITYIIFNSFIIISCYNYKDNVFEIIKKYRCDDKVNGNRITLMFWLRLIPICGMNIYFLAINRTIINQDINQLISSGFVISTIYIGWFLTLNQRIVIKMKSLIKYSDMISRIYRAHGFYGQDINKKPNI